ncbi:hypothetical protein SNEBB_007555 [Seison nebaliae]|nr:hypothetical protein SNEBB_007555 [Seison nebaliae]
MADELMEEIECLQTMYDQDDDVIQVTLPSTTNNSNVLGEVEYQLYLTDNKKSEQDKLLTLFFKIIDETLRIEISSTKLDKSLLEEFEDELTPVLEEGLVSVVNHCSNHKDEWRKRIKEFEKNKYEEKMRLLECRLDISVPKTDNDDVHDEEVKNKKKELKIDSLSIEDQTNIKKMKNLSKNAKRKLWDKGGRKERGDDWVDIIKHLSQTASH